MAEVSTRLVVGVGYGLGQIARLVSALPPDGGFALIAVILDGADLAAALQDKSKLPVGVAELELAIEPNRIYVAPPMRDVVIQRGLFAIGPSRIPGVQIDRL